MIKEVLPGKFIVFEGLDGADTLSHAEKLSEWLEKQGSRTHLTREPTDGPIGSLLRLHIAGRLKIDDKAIALFFAADRMDHLYRHDTGIIQLLGKGQYVVCDRYYLSSYAYQLLEDDEDGIDLPWLRQLNKKCRPPDLTLFIDVPTELCLRRMVEQRGFHRELIEKKQEELKRIRTNYLAAIDILQEEEAIEIINGSDPPAMIERAVQRAVKKALGF